LKRLAELGHRVAICEQIEAPSRGGGRKLVRRDVVEVITPGLVGDPDGLEAHREVSLVALDFESGGDVGFAALEASTGELRATSVRADGTLLPGALAEELRRVSPREVLLPRARAEELAAVLRALLPDAVTTLVEPASFDPATVPVTPAGFAGAARDAATRAAAALLHYLAVNQPFALSHVARLARYALGDAMQLDAATRAPRTFENTIDRTRRGTRSNDSM
jgi:DNA mismatch repair protein MutS